MATQILNVQGLTKRFGGLIAVNEVDFHVHEGEIVGIIGPNGAGKTTLFNLVAGHLRPDRGRISFYQESIESLWPAHRRCALGIARTFQEAKPFRQLDVLENVMVGAYAKVAATEEAERIAWEALEITQLDHLAYAPADSLTIVDRKKLEMARALATRPKLLLLDEVMAGLTPTELQDVLELIRSLRQRGITLLIIEHIMQAIMSISDRIVVLNYGRKIAEGPPQQISKDPRVIEAYLGEEYKIA